MAKNDKPSIPELVAKLSQARTAEREALAALESEIQSVEAGTVYHIDGVPMMVAARNQGTKEAPNYANVLIPAVSKRQLAIMRGETPPPLGRQGRRGARSATPAS